MLAKRFFYVSAGLFLLALTYHLGARNASAQLGSSIVGAAVSTHGSGQYFVATPSGKADYRK